MPSIHKKDPLVESLDVLLGRAREAGVLRSQAHRSIDAPRAKGPSGAALRKRYGHKKNTHSENARRYWAKQRQYLTVDGEAVNDRYVLLACSDGSKIINRKGLSTYECLVFLTTRKQPRLWGFAFDYDVNMMLGGLTVTQLTRLSRHNVARFGEFRIEHIPGKMLRVTDRRHERTVTVWDAFSFVRSSFAKWIEDWQLVNAKDLAFIEEMKLLRPTFTLRQLATVTRYCLTELDYLDRGISELLDRVQAAGFRPTAWHSPASVSAAAMRHYRIKDYMETPPKKVLAAAEAAYFGGRFETRITGELRSPLYHYDIRSAYPAALVGLPCLKHGRWKHTHKPNIEHPHSLIYVRWRAKPPWRKPADRPPWGPFPVRVSVGSLRYPLVHPGGWYWGHEVSAAKTLTHLHLVEAWEFTPGCDHQPFDWIQDLYDQRRELVRRGDPAQYTYKLVLNSCYGKLAQRKRRRRAPAFRSVVWAGMVTSHCRAQLLGAISQDPEAVIQTATDGLTSTRKLDLPLGSALGAWESQALERLLIVQSGIYFWRDWKRRKVQRSRGFHPRQMTYRRVVKAWRANPVADLVFDNTRFVGYRSALHRGDLARWRTWENYRVRLSFQPEPRRDTVQLQDNMLLSAPPIYAQPDLFDLLEDTPDPWLAERASITEQPDGPSGDML